MNGQIRQGDILLIPVDIAPPEKAEVTNRVVLATGEVTGHAHVLAADRVLTWEAGGQRYVWVGGRAPGTITHEDHDPVPAAVVQPGQTYEVRRQREWDLQAQWQQVQD